MTVNYLKNVWNRWSRKVGGVVVGGWREDKIKVVIL